MASVLSDWGGAGDLVFDPFGASPRLVREAAEAGRRVLVAANNPVTRFVIQHVLAPFNLADLQSALARIASAPKDGGRLEPFLLDLYRTNCSRCGESLAADMFIWTKETKTPSLKVYACPECGNAVQEGITQADVELALSFEGRGLHHALALQRVLPPDDPDRIHAEAALAIYTGRALYGITALLNKVEQLALIPAQQSAIQAILLSAFDLSNTLWDYPEGRDRPLQLEPSTQYREMNLWRAMESAVREWAGSGRAIEWKTWAREELPEAGSVAIFPGRVRDLVTQLDPGSLSLVVTVLPRPNHAFWALSALWASWLWGRRIAAPIMATLRRRRYDWTWHATALRAGLNSVRPAMEGGGNVMAFIPEAEPGFLAAALAGFDKAGFAITGRALRHDASQAAFSWTAAGGVTLPVEKQILAQCARAAMTELLRQRAEPTHYDVLHAAVWSDLAQKRLLASSWPKVGSPPLSLVGAEIDAALEDRDSFERLDPWSSVDSGIYWLREAQGLEAPLADRIELHLLEELRQRGQLSMLEIEQHVGNVLRGLLTPDRGLLMACLRSYADALLDGAWRLKEHEAIEARRRECGDLVASLLALGKRLGYSVKGKDPVVWREAHGEVSYRFRVQETAALGDLLVDERDPTLTIVLPGSRSALVAEKARRNPLLHAWFEAGNRVVKFRHIRHLAGDAKLSREAFGERLGLDPAEERDPHMHLL